MFIIRDRNVLNIAQQVSLLGTPLKRGKRELRIRRAQIHKIARKVKVGEYMKARGRRWRKGFHPSLLVHFNSVPLLIARQAMHKSK